MKIRVGFVSNSSSSSFILIIKKDAYNDWLLKADPLDRAIVDATMRKNKVLGIDCMVYKRASSDGDGGSFENINIDKIVKKAKKLAKTQGCSLAKNLAKENDMEEDEIDDDWLYDAVSEGLYDVECYFIKYLKSGEAWSHEQNW